jgi:integrase
VPTTTPGIYRRGSRYVVRFRDPQGRQRQRSACTLAEARALKAALVADVRRGEYRALSRVSFADYAREWIAGYQGRTGRGIRPETLADYARDLELHALPYFGRRLLAEIEPRDVKGFARTLADAGKAPATVRAVMAPVRALFATAVEEGLIRHNPAAGLRLAGGAARPQPKALSPEELARLIEAMPAGQPRLIVRFLAATGLRSGELVALTWQDLDLAERRVHVRARIYRGRRDAPKSRYGIRQVPLSEQLARDLAAHRLASRFCADGDPVFASEAGTPLDSSNFARRYLKPAAQAAGLLDEEGRPWPSYHTLRHTCASNLLRAGASPKQAQLWLGHHAAAFTLDTYTHLLPDDLPDGDILDRFGGVGGVNKGSTQAPEKAGGATPLDSRRKR